MVLDILVRYGFTDNFKSNKEAINWFNKLNKTQKENILSLNINPSLIKFDKDLLFNEDLLNKKDYLQRVNEFISIDNAEGWYHLFDRMVRKEFLDSPKFYQDIETLKRCECAQVPLWIIGETSFINSPYHDEDFECLVTAKDPSDRKLDWLVRENIAKVAECEASIKSKHHRDDIQMILNCGSDSLQMTSSYPKSSIGYLAQDPVSLNDKYHRENMEILKENYKYDIGGYLYQVMTNKDAIKHRDYRRVIEDMIDNRDKEPLVFLLCMYLVGYDNAKNGENICLNNPDYELWINHIDMWETIKMIEEKYNTIESECVETELLVENNVETNTKPKSLIKRILNRKNK